MAHFNITYQMLEHFFKPTLNGRYIIRVKPHPWMPRTLMAEFPGDPDYDEPIPLTDEVVTLDEVIQSTEEKFHG